MGFSAVPFARLERRQTLLLLAATCVVEAVLLGVVAVHRGIDADEGFYLMAGWRVLAGHALYADFFYPQMPYLPYIHAAVLALTGPSLVAGRLVGVVTGALLAGVLAVVAARATGRVRVGIAIAGLYAANALVISIVSTAKTYGVANLALVGAFLLLAAPKARVWCTLIAGLSAGLAVGIRLPAAAAVMVLFVWSIRGGIRNALVFAAGVAIALLPCLWIALGDPKNFWFCNFEFHALRREITGDRAVLLQKAVILAKWTLLPQNLVAWALALAGLRLQPRAAIPAIACALALGLAYLMATPTYLQYLTQIVPFLLLAGIPALAVLLERRNWAIVVAGVYGIGLLLAMRTPPEGAVRGQKVQFWRLDAVQAVAAYLQQHTQADDQVLSWWEGYPFLARRPGFVGVGFWESNVAKKLPADARRRHHVLNQEDVRQLIAGEEPRLIVFPDGTWEHLDNTINDHYRQVARFGSTRVFGRRDSAAPHAGSAGDLRDTSSRDARG